MHLHRLLPFVVAAGTIANVCAHHLGKAVLLDNIIWVMTVIAGVNLVISRNGVAGGTGNGAQPPMIQGEGVFKGYDIPSLWCVAHGAVRAKLPEMHIILGMTGDALGWRAAVDIVYMALRAFHLLVLANQLEGGEIVVKNLRVPTLRVMAARTIDAKVRQMRILRFITAHTID